MALSEADTRAKLIDPAIHKRGWTEDLIRREETAGAIDVDPATGRARRRARGRVDYVLRVKANSGAQALAVALIEAKPDSEPPTKGMEQAKAYASARRMNVPFIYSSNGHLFVEYDQLSGLTSSPKPLAEFPTPADLRRRYEGHVGFGLGEKVAAPLLAKYHLGEGACRYYQDAAIRAALEKIARAEKEGKPARVLLALATGSGKTRIAVNLLRKIADAGQLRRALFVCDRDELRLQAASAFAGAFGADAAVVESGMPQKNARVLIATYQTLDVASEEASANFLTDNYPPDYFSHIVIDECHRSAWGKWSQVLTRNGAAVQIGLTATPRRLEGIPRTKEAQADLRIVSDNYAHFGEPVYEYDMGQGIEDGYLAACEIHQFDLFHDNKKVSEREAGVTKEDLTGKWLTDARTGAAVSAEELQDWYSAPELEDKLISPERVAAMTKDLFQHLIDTGGP